MKAMPRPTVVAAVMRYWALTLVFVVIGGVLGALAARAMLSSPKAMAIVVVRDPRATGVSDGTAEARYAAEQAAVMGSDLVLAPTVKALAKAAPPVAVSLPQLRGGLSVTVPPDNSALQVSYRDADPARAAVVANAIVHQYRVVSRAQLVDDASAQLAQIDSELAALERKIPRTGNSPAADLARAERTGLLALRSNVVAELTAGDGVTAVAPATAPSAASSHSAALRGAGLGAIVALLLGAVCAALLANRRQRWDGSAQPGVLFDSPCVAELALPRRLDLTRKHFDNTAANLLGVQHRIRAWSIGIVAQRSRLPSADITIALGAAAARLGRRPLLIVSRDADLADLGQQLVVDAETDDALLSAFGGNAVHALLLADGSRLHIAATDVPQAEAFLHAARQIPQVRERYDLVLVHIAASAQAPDILLTSCVDANVVLIDHRSRVRTTEDLAERLDTTSGTTAGYIYVSGKHAPAATKVSDLVKPPSGRNTRSELVHVQQPTQT